MQIRHKIILWFVGLTGFLLFLFSFYIYIAFSSVRKKEFQERIKNKAYATLEIYEEHDVVAEKIITSIPEQSEYVFDENHKLIFAINDQHDFIFNEKFFRTVDRHKKYFFDYAVTGKSERKEGFAFTPNVDKKHRIIVITAFDKGGYEEVRTLETVLIFGTIIFLTFIGVSGYLFSVNALRPINKLVSQVESTKANNLNFRLRYGNPNDEIGIVASSFNRVLDQIQSLVESQKGFISYASHELRTPLAAVSGILETSIQYDNDIDTAKHNMKASLKELQKAAGLVNGLLQLAKVESVHAIDEKEKINIIDLLIDTISFFKLKNPTQEFLLDITERIPKDVYIELTGNLHFLRTALFNIIDNASKYSHLQKIQISVSIVSPSNISIKVIDSGIGIEKEEISHIINPLFRGKNIAGVEGYGLGLALTHRIVNLHHGELHFVENPTGGMIVEIILPAQLRRNL